MVGFNPVTTSHHFWGDTRLGNTAAPLYSGFFFYRTKTDKCRFLSGCVCVRVRANLWTCRRVFFGIYVAMGVYQVPGMSVLCVYVSFYARVHFMCDWVFFFS